MPVEVPSTPPAPINERLQSILFAGQLSKSKGLLELLRAADLLWKSGRDFTLHVAGEGPLRGAVEKLSRRWFGKVLFHGLLPFSQIETLMAGMDLLVQPSHWEGVSGSVLESLAMGVPVIATAAGGMRELTDAEVVERVQPGDVRMLQLAIARLADRPARRSELSRRGWAHVGDHYGWDIAFRRFCEVYAMLGVRLPDVNRPTARAQKGGEE